jgi:hypothetical protein
MSAATLILAGLIAGTLWVIRSRWTLIAGAWRAARWWERGLLLLALAPIPGPVDELVGAFVVQRVLRRRGRNAAGARITP